MCGKHEVTFYLLYRLGLLFGDALSSTMLLTFILFWTLSHNYVHLF
jgi:hypothetical protein